MLAGFNQEMQGVDLGPRVGVTATDPVGHRVVGLAVGLQVVDGHIDVAFHLFLGLVVKLDEVVQIELREGL